MNHHIYRFAAVSTSLLLSVSGLAADFNSTLSRLVENSPSLKYYAAEADATIKESRTYNNLPDPEIEGEHMWGTRGQTKWNAGISWTIDWPGAYSARGNVAKAQKDAEISRLESRRRSLENEVGTQLIAYAKATRRLNVIRRLEASTDSMALIIEAGIKHGRLTTLDSYKINIEKGRLAAAIEEEKGTVSECRAAIVALCGADADIILQSFDTSFPDDPGFGTAYYIDKVNGTPDVKLATAEACLARARQKSVDRELFPSLSLGYIHAYEEETHFNGGKIGLSLPVFSSKGKRAASKAATVAAESNAENIRESLTAQVRIWCSRLDATRASLTELSPVFNTESPQDMLYKAYRLERLSLLEYLQERNYYMEAELDYIDLLAARAEILNALSTL